MTFPEYSFIPNSEQTYHTKMTKIWVTFQKHGIHYYPEAATSEALKDVSYLGTPHRHLFKFKVSISVNHNNRDIEFHQFQNWLMSFYEAGQLSLDSKSCEMIAEDLSVKILERYPQSNITIEVSEDGECGAEITRSPIKQGTQ